MSRYFFHFCDGVDHVDSDGIELADHLAARKMALTTAGEAIMGLGARSPGGGGEWRTWVTDESGSTVCAYTFKADEEPT